MKINSKPFGEIEVEESNVLTFSEGLPGFVELRKFVLLPEPDGGFFWLQSIEQEETSFILLDAHLYDPEYDPAVEESMITELGEYSPETFVVLNIANLQGAVKDITVNYRAPIVINTAKKLGKQVICNNEDYSVKHYLFRESEV